MQCFLAKIQIMCVMCNSVKICFLSFSKQLYQKDCILSQFWHFVFLLVGGNKPGTFSFIVIGWREQTSIPIGRREHTSIPIGRREHTSIPISQQEHFFVLIGRRGQNSLRTLCSDVSLAGCSRSGRRERPVRLT